MVGTMIAKWVADAFGEHGIYDRHIILNNYPFLDTKSKYHYSTTLWVACYSTTTLIICFRCLQYGSLVTTQLAVVNSLVQQLMSTWGSDRRSKG